MVRNLPINFILPAFPFKSGNYEHKTLSHLPDKGEELALESINNFCEKVNSIYRHGVIFNIVSDGRVFADIFYVEDYKVDVYHSEIRRKYKQYTKFINFYDLEDFLDTSGKHDEGREKLTNLFGKSITKINKKIETDQEYTKTYLGFSMFVFEDLFKIMNEFKENNLIKANKVSMMNYEGKVVSKRTALKDGKILAKKVMIRNDAYSSMIQNLFPIFVRLSIHAHNNAGPKFAVRLLPADKVSDVLVEDKHMHIPTPWHNVVVEDKNGKFMLIKKSKVKDLPGKYDLVYDIEGSPSHYKQFE